MAELPCKDKFDKMEDAIKTYEDCFDAIDQDQDLVVLGGIGTVLACLFRPLAKSCARRDSSFQLPSVH